MIRIVRLKELSFIVTERGSARIILLGSMIRLAMFYVSARAERISSRSRVKYREKSQKVTRRRTLHSPCPRYEQQWILPFFLSFRSVFFELFFPLYFRHVSLDDLHLCSHRKSSEFRKSVPTLFPPVQLMQSFSSSSSSSFSHINDRYHHPWAENNLHSISRTSGKNIFKIFHFSHNLFRR